MHQFHHHYDHRHNPQVSRQPENNGDLPFRNELSTRYCRWSGAPDLMQRESNQLKRNMLGRSYIWKGIQWPKGRGPKKIDFFLGNSPKQRTPPTHRSGLGLT